MTNDEWHDYALLARFDKIFRPYTPLFIGDRGYHVGNLQWSNTWSDILIVANEILNRTDK